MTSQTISLNRFCNKYIAAFITLLLFVLNYFNLLVITLHGDVFLTYFTFTSGFIFTAYITVLGSESMSIVKNIRSKDYHEIVATYKEALMVNFMGILICSIQIIFSLELKYLFVFVLVLSFLKIIDLAMDTLEFLKLGVR